MTGAASACACRCSAPTTRSTRSARSRRPAWRARTARSRRARWRAFRAREGALSWSARPRPARASMTTTRTTRARWRRRSRPRARSTAGGWWRSFSRTCTRVRSCSRGSSARRCAAADVIAVSDVYPARERAEDFPGVSGLLVAQAAADAAPGRLVLWLPTLTDARAVAARAAVGRRRLRDDGRGKRRSPRARARSGACTSARSVGAAGARMSAARVPAVGVQRDYPMARLTTVRTGGPAQWFARAGSERQLLELLAWARAAGFGSSVVGSGSNLLVADDGVRGLVLKLDRELARIEVRAAAHRLRRRRAPAGAGHAGGARGAVGDRVRRQHPGHRGRRGAHERKRLRRAARRGARVGASWRSRRRTARGGAGQRRRRARAPAAFVLERRAPDELGLSYRSSRLSDEEIVTRACFLLEPAEVAQREGDDRRHAQPVATRPSRRGSGRSARRSRTRRTRAPRVARPGSCCLRRGATGWRSGARGSRPSTRTSSRTPARRRPPRSSR